MQVKSFTAAIGWFILILILLCLPGSAIPKYSWLATVYADKWVHIFLFGMLCSLFMRPFQKSNYNDEQCKKFFVLIMLAGIAYGTMMEFVQKYWIPNRSFEILDIAADSTGCLLAYVYSLKKFLGVGRKKIGPDRNRDRNQN